jgi:hypothetical protein
MYSLLCHGWMAAGPHLPMRRPQPQPSEWEGGAGAGSSSIVTERWDSRRRSWRRSRTSLASSADGEAVDDGADDAPVNTLKLVGENLERQTYVFEVRLSSPLGINLAEEPAFDEMESSGGGGGGSPGTVVVVQSVVPGASADIAGLRQGDRIIATGAAIGGAMWEKRTLDGVTAAVQSRVRFGAVALRIERPFDNADEVSWRSVVSETIQVEVRKPLDMVLEERGEGDDRAVFVKRVEQSGDASGKIKAGDRVVAVSASFGDGMWASRTVEGVVSAISTRIGSTVKLTLERQVRVGDWGDHKYAEGGRGAIGQEGHEEGGVDGGEDYAEAGEAAADNDDDDDDDDDDEEYEADGAGRSDQKSSGTDGRLAEANGERASSLGGIGSTLETLEELQRTEGLTTNSTRAVLLERCCALLNR